MIKVLKKLTLILLLAGVVFSGCKEAEEPLDIKFTVGYEAEFEIVVPPATSHKADINGMFSETETIDPYNNSNYAQYIDQVNSVEVKDVNFEVLSVSKDVTLLSTKINISNANQSAVWEFTNIPLAVGTMLTLDNNSGQWEAIENMFKDKDIFTASIEGETDEDDAQFVLLLTIKTEFLSTDIKE